MPIRIFNKKKEEGYKKYISLYGDDVSRLIEVPIKYRTPEICEIAMKKNPKNLKNIPTTSYTENLFIIGYENGLSFENIPKKYIGKELSDKVYNKELKLTPQLPEMFITQEMAENYVSKYPDNVMLLPKKYHTEKVYNVAKQNGASIESIPKKYYDKAFFENILNRTDRCYYLKIYHKIPKEFLDLNICKMAVILGEPLESVIRDIPTEAKTQEFWNFIGCVNKDSYKLVPENNQTSSFYAKILVNKTRINQNQEQENLMNFINDIPQEKKNKNFYSEILIDFCSKKSAFYLPYTAFGFLIDNIPNDLKDIKFYNSCIEKEPYLIDLFKNYEQHKDYKFNFGLNDISYQIAIDNGFSLKNASDLLKNNINMVLIAMKKDQNELQYASKELQKQIIEMLEYIDFSKIIQMSQNKSAAEIYEEFKVLRQSSTQYSLKFIDIIKKLQTQFQKEQSECVDYIIALRKFNYDCDKNLLPSPALADMEKSSCYSYVWQNWQYPYCIEKMTSKKLIKSLDTLEEIQTAIYSGRNKNVVDYYIESGYDIAKFSLDEFSKIKRDLSIYDRVLYEILAINVLEQIRRLQENQGVVNQEQLLKSLEELKKDYQENLEKIEANARLLQTKSLSDSNIESSNEIYRDESVEDLDKAIDDLLNNNLNPTSSEHK